MKSYLKLAVLSLSLAVGNYIYLTVEYFKVQLGMSDGSSLCNINELFDCSAVAASSYSSLFGIPISIYGGLTNFILLIMVGGLFIGFSENAARLRRYSLWLASFTVAASLIMGTISALQLGVLCLFCIGAYVLSFLVLFFVWKADPEDKVLPQIGTDLTALFKESKSVLGLFILIPVLAFGVDRLIRSEFKLNNMHKVIKISINSWKSNPKHVFTDTPALLSHGTKTPTMIITEFADYRCPHCYRASPSIEAFLKSHPKQVKLNFYVFPLDGSCNEAITRKNGLSCRLAKAVYCGSQQTEMANAGWKMHHLIFENFKAFRALSSVEDIDKHLTKVSATPAGSFYNWDTLKECLEKPTTHDAILAQGALGVKSDVEGTPSIYVNGRKLPGGHMVPVLDAALKAISTQ